MFIKEEVEVENKLVNISIILIWPYKVVKCTWSNFSKPFIKVLL